MKSMVVLAGDDSSAVELERAGVTVVRAADAEDAIRVAAANNLAAIVLDRQHCGALELVAAVSQLTSEAGRRVVVIDHIDRTGGDELTQSLRARAQVTVCNDGAGAAVAISGLRGPLSRPSALPLAAETGTKPTPERTVAVLQPQVLPVVSAKGGVGKTTVATNLAALMAAADLASTVLADLATTNSDVSVGLELPEGPGLADLAASPDRLAELPCHRGTKLHVLAGLAKPEDAESLTQTQLESTIASLRRQYAIVVLDLASDPTSDILYHCIEQASSVILVSTLDAASLRDTRLFLNVLKRLNVRLAERVKVVLNRVRGDSVIDPARAEEFLGLTATCSIPDDPRSVDAAAYAGTPLVLARPNHPFSQAIRRLAGSISPAFAQTPPARSQVFWRRNRG